MFLTDFAWKKLGIFAGGVLFGTAGMKILASKDAKKVYTEAAAAVLRGQDCVMKVSTSIKEKRAEEEEKALICDGEAEFDGKEV